MNKDHLLFSFTALTVQSFSFLTRIYIQYLTEHCIISQIDLLLVVCANRLAGMRQWARVVEIWVEYSK